MLRRCLPLAGILLFVPAFGSVRAQIPPPGAESLERGFHIVRAGETLEMLAVRYLGSHQAWKRLAELNPDIADPDLIEPGQRILVMVPRRAPLAVAQVERISRKVEEQPQPQPWLDAQVGDLLQARDAVRTFSRSSAVMEFRDGTRLVVTEDSLVYLSRTGSSLQGVPAHSVEIVEGQADVAMEARQAAEPYPEVEIVLGPARARSRPSSAGQAQARARKAEAGGAKVMVYGGEGEVEAGGATVQVAQGMGTSVDAQGPPAPPERLLPAPRPTSPAPGSAALCANPILSWAPVPEAAAYVVEICRDPGCGELVERATGIGGTAWRAPVLPAGDFHWRITARSRSGLDGYPGEGSLISIRPDSLDRTPPTGSIRVDGPSAWVGDKLWFGPGARLEVAAADDGSGLEGWTPAVDGRPADAAALAGPWPGGEHKVEAVALDLCGNRGLIETVSFSVDAEPPVLEWRMVEAARGWRGRGLDARSDNVREPGLSWPLGLDEGRLRWNPGWVGAQAGAVHETLVILSDLPQAAVRLEGVKLVAMDSSVPAPTGPVLHLGARDAASRVERLTLRTRSTAEGPVLEAEALDLVGNVGRMVWKIESRKD